MVYQSLALVDHLDVTGNFFLGNELRYPPPLSWIGILRKRKMRAQAAVDVQRLNIGIRSVDELVAGLSGGQRQSIAIVRAIARGRQTIIMDEPTAALGVRESAQVMDTILRCRDEGMGVILISHNMQEVFHLADRISVFRLGRTVACVDKNSSTPSEVVALMTGARVPNGNGGDTYRTEGGNE
jgi:fructose transport system ATP-binding protein